MGKIYSYIRVSHSDMNLDRQTDAMLDMPLLDTRQHKNLLGTVISDLVLQVLSFVSESERTSIKSRQKEEIVSAKKCGVKFGRPERVVSDKQKSIISLYLQKWESQEITTKFFMEKLESFYL